MKCIVTIGAPASGKSVWTAEFIEEQRAKHDLWFEVNRDNVRFNEVQPGGNWSTWNWKNEDKVSEIIEKQIEDYAKHGCNIVVSDTNITEKYRDKLTQKLITLGYEVEYKVFDVPYEELVKRDVQRNKPVGAFTVAKHHFAKVEQFGKRYIPDESKPKAIIADIDGTIAKMNGRGPFEWHRVGEDSPRIEVMAAIEGLSVATGAVVLCTSGRDEVCREETTAWLNKHGFWHTALFMRQKGDMRKDTLVKEEIFWNQIAPNYNVVGAFDDRPVIVRLWYELGVPNVFAVANPYLEF